MKVTNEQAVGRDVARNFRQLATELETATTDLAAVDARVIVLENLGHVVSASTTTTQSGITAATDITGLSVTFTAVGGRRLRVSATLRMAVITTLGTAELLLTDGSNNIIDKASITLEPGYTSAFHVWTIQTPAAGSVTYKVRATVGGGGSITTQPSATQVGRLLVEDIGLA